MLLVLACVETCRHSANAHSVSSTYLVDLVINPLTRSAHDVAQSNGSHCLSRSKSSIEFSPYDSQHRWQSAAEVAAAIIHCMMLHRHHKTENTGHRF